MKDLWRGGEALKNASVAILQFNHYWSKAVINYKAKAIIKMCRFGGKAKTWGSLPLWWKMEKFCSRAAVCSQLENTSILGGRKLLLLCSLVIVNSAFAARTKQLNLQVNPWFTRFLTSFKQKNTGSWLMLEKQQVSLKEVFESKGKELKCHKRWRWKQGNAKLAHCI